MADDRITQYRAQAASCLIQANLDQNKSTASRWIKIAEEWNRMADELERIRKPSV